MQTFSIYLRPEDPDSGLPEYATCLEERAAWIAKSKALSMLEALAPDTVHQYAEPLAGEDRPGLPRPVMNVLSTDFLKTCYWDEENQVFAERQELASKPVNYDALSSDQKMAVLVRHGTTEIDSMQLTDALQLLNDERDTPEGHIVESLIRTKVIAAMYPEVVLELIGELGNHFDGADNWPQMKAFNEKWLKYRQASRKDTGDKVTTLRTASGSKAGGGNPLLFTLKGKAQKKRSGFRAIREISDAFDAVTEPDEQARQQLETLIENRKNVLPDDEYQRFSIALQDIFA